MKPSMKITILSWLLCSTAGSFGVGGLGIEVQGTNIVLSWPSKGYEIYLIQSLTNLGSGDPWSCVTNAYPANSTNRTTFTVFDVLPAAGNENGGNVAAGFQNRRPSAVFSNEWPPLPPLPWEIDESDYTSDGRSRFSSGADFGDSGNFHEPTMCFYRVFHVPNFLADVENYLFDGPTFIPVDYADYVDRVDKTTVLVNGEPTDLSQFMSYNYGGQTYWGVGIYCDQLGNGNNTIQLLATIRLNDALGDDTSYITLSNAVVTFTTDNLVTFTNWDDLIWQNTNYTFRAQSSIPDVDWEIDVYDIYGYFVNYQAGHTTDGSIAWTWDLTDYWGYLRADPDADPVFYPEVTITRNSQSQVINQNQADNTTRPTPPVAAPFPNNGAWIVAYADNFYSDGTDKYAGAEQYYSPGIAAIHGGPSLWGVTSYDYPIKYGTNYSQADRDDSWHQLTYKFLGSSDGQIRNFYYFGHGAPTKIGGDANIVEADGTFRAAKIYGGSKAFLNSQTAKDEITFNKNSGLHFYRFVFLDGCNTANGDWPEAFGVDKTTHDINFYTSASNKWHIRPSAFIGWNTTIGGSKEWGTIQKFWQFRGFWMGNWSVTYTGVNLVDALESARSGSGWISLGQYQDHIRIFGYPDLKFNEYNHKGDWAP